MIEAELSLKEEQPFASIPSPQNVAAATETDVEELEAGIATHEEFFTEDDQVSEGVIEAEQAFKEEQPLRSWY